MSKVLLISNYFFPHNTGLSQYAVNLASSLAEKGNLVTVLTADYLGNLPRKESWEEVNVIRLWAPIRVSRAMMMPSLLLKLVCLREKFDVMLLFLPFPHVLEVALLTKLFGKKLLLVHNGDLLLPKGIINRLIEYVNNTLTVTAGLISDRVIIQTEDYANNSKSLPWLRGKWRAILPIIKLPKANDKAARLLRKKWQINSKTKIIGFCGRFVREKAPDVLLRALPMMASYYNYNIRLIIAGPRVLPYENYYKTCFPLLKKSGKYCIWLGNIRDRKEMANYYAALDVLVSSSRIDCYPFTVAESLISRTPVVAADIPGVRTMLEETGGGELYINESPEDLARAVIRVITDRSDYAKKTKNIFQLVRKDRSVSDYEKLF